MHASAEFHNLLVAAAFIAAIWLFTIKFVPTRRL